MNKLESALLWSYTCKVLPLSSLDSISDLIQTSHWLHFPARNDFKLCSIDHKLRLNRGTQYPTPLHGKDAGTLHGTGFTAYIPITEYTKWSSLSIGLFTDNNLLNRPITKLFNHRTVNHQTVQSPNWPITISDWAVWWLAVRLLAITELSNHRTVNHQTVQSPNWPITISDWAVWWLAVRWLAITELSNHRTVNHQTVQSPKCPITISDWAVWWLAVRWLAITELSNHRTDNHGTVQSPNCRSNHRFF